MAKAIDIQAVVKHIVNGSFADSLCRICLQPLGDGYENVFTRVMREGMDYCIADVLHDVCQVKITHSEQSKVCSNCFFEASAVYKFYLLSKRTEEILMYYVNELYKHIESINIPQQSNSDSIFIKLPMYAPQTEVFNYNLSGLCLKSNTNQYHDTLSNDGADAYKFDTLISREGKNIGVETTLKCTNALEMINKIDKEDSDVVMVMSENGEPTFFKANDDGSLMPLDLEDLNPDYFKLLEADSETPNISDNPQKEVNDKRRHRSKMDYKKCSQCPIKYRFVAKLKQHMKAAHNIDIFFCKVCKDIIENEEDFNNHLKTHTNVHRCSICNALFKKRETILAHFKSHAAMRELSKAKSARVCEICGWILKDEDSLKNHYQDKHVKKYTCYYCGRMYKGEASFEMHIKKHEAYSNQKCDTVTKESSKDKEREKASRPRFVCSTCGNSFVDERARMWHERLHTNERPYVCQVCGRAFVSLSRRNQHALCAHSAPARRCPLCPALFHLRSMVNSHIKKVHLSQGKRRARGATRPAAWRARPVPLQELSVAVQGRVLDLAARARADARQLRKSSMKLEEPFYIAQ